MTSGGNSALRSTGCSYMLVKDQGGEGGVGGGGGALRFRVQGLGFRV